jgi:integrase
VFSVARRNNGEGTIRYDRERKRWEARITTEIIDGRQVRKKLTAKSKDELLEHLKQARKAVDEGLPAPDRRETVAKFLDGWLEHLAHTDRSSATVVNYTNVVNYYVTPKLGRVKLTELAPRHVEKMQRDILADGKSARTARLSRSVLRAALRHAERHGLVSRNAAALAEPVKAEHHEKETMTAAQVTKLFAAAAGGRDECALVLLVTLGLRRSELLGLQWSDVNAKAGTVRISRALKRTPAGLEVSETKTGGSERTLQLVPLAVKALKSHKARQAEQRIKAGEHWTDGNWIFTHAWGGPIDPDNFRHRFVALCDKAGIGHWSPHAARHTAGSLMFEHGADLKVVSQALGHSSIRVTADVYAHLLPERSGEAAAAMARALAPKRRVAKA